MTVSSEGTNIVSYPGNLRRKCVEGNKSLPNCNCIEILNIPLNWKLVMGISVLPEPGTAPN